MTIKNLTPLLAVTALAAGISLWQPKSLCEAPLKTEVNTVEVYYPPSESAGGWRRCRNDEEVLRLSGMDPKKLARVGRRCIWRLLEALGQLLVVRHGYIVT